MAVKAKTLLSNANVTSGWISFPGGRAALVLMATTYPTTLKLQLMGQDGTTAIDIATLTANGVTLYDLPAGSYRMSVAGGAPAAIYADLVSVPYM
jgi:hypothetical protein